MYTFSSKIRYSELDETGHLSIEALLDYFQDCSTFQSEELGIGRKYLTEHQMVWVMSYWQIIVERYPQIGEKVTIGTAPYEFKGFLGCRNFWMKSEAGENLACANSIWSLLSTQTGYPVKPEPKMLESYALEPKLDMNYAPRKILIPARLEEGAPVEIHRHHLDSNHHVNNGQFVRIAMENLDCADKIRQLRVEYKKQVHLGEWLVPCTGITEEKNRVIVLKNREGDICCILELQEER